MSTPAQRIIRLLDEGARFMVELPGHVAIDLTPDVIAAMAEGSNREPRLKSDIRCEESSPDAPAAPAHR